MDSDDLHYMINNSGMYVRRRKVPDHARDSGWGNGEKMWLDDEGHWRYDPPRTKMSHPYNYEPFDRFHHGYKRDDKTIHAVYSDRMQQWDHTKFRDALNSTNDGNHVGELHFSWGNHAKVTQFMRHYYGDPKLQVVRVQEQCNASSGYPLWVIFYRNGKDAK